ncbi:hypothetical protein D3C72_1143510 [compost metagenome]
MQVRARGVAGRADLADHITRLDLLAGFDVDGRLVGVHGDRAVVVLDNGEVAIAAAVAGRDDHTVLDRLNRRARGLTDIEPLVVGRVDSPRRFTFAGARGDAVPPAGNRVDHLGTRLGLRLRLDLGLNARSAGSVVDRLDHV